MHIQRTRRNQENNMCETLELQLQQHLAEFLRQWPEERIHLVARLRWYLLALNELSRRSEDVLAGMLLDLVEAIAVGELDVTAVARKVG